MSTDLLLRRRAGGLPLTARRVSAALEQLTRDQPLAARVTDNETAIRFRVELPADDEKCAAIGVRFARSGARVVGTTAGRGGPLLYWCFQALSEALDAELRDPQSASGGPGTPVSEADARAVVAEHEREVLAERAYSGHGRDRAGGDDDRYDDLPRQFASFVDALVAAETLSLAPEGAAGLAQLAPLMNDAPALYEALLDSPGVDDIFVSEAEFLKLFAHHAVNRRV